MRVQLCRELIGDVRRVDQQLSDNQAEAARLLDEHATRLRQDHGVGPVLAARILGRTGHVSRFATAAAYATYNGTAPIEVTSAEYACHRLNRFGNGRQGCTGEPRFSVWSVSAAIASPSASWTTLGLIHHRHTDFRDD